MSPARSDRPSASTTTRPDRAGFRNSNPRPRRAVGDRPSRPGMPASEPVDLLLLRLRLLRLRVLRAEPLDEALELRDLLGVALRGTRRMLRPRGLLAPPDVPLPGEVDGAPAVELEDGGRDRLEEPAVVGDEDHGGVDRGEHPLEPLERLDVEVVRRLVEEEQVGLRGERARQRGAGQLAARERRERPVEVGVREAEPADDRGGPVAPVVAARVLEPCLGGGVPAHRPPVVRAACHLGLELAQLRLERDQVGRSRRGRTRAAAARSSPAGAGRGARPARPFSQASSPPSSETSPVSARSSVVLPGAVRPGEREPVAPLDLERHPVEQGRPRELLAEIGCDQDRHEMYSSRATPVLA